MDINYIHLFSFCIFFSFVFVSKHFSHVFFMQFIPLCLSFLSMHHSFFFFPNPLLLSLQPFLSPKICQCNIPDTIRAFHFSFFYKQFIPLSFLRFYALPINFCLCKLPLIKFPTLIIARGLSMQWFRYNKRLRSFFEAADHCKVNSVISAAFN